MKNIQNGKAILDKYGDNNYLRTVNQHYVPQFYLKQFANDNKKIEVVDKEHKRIETCSVKHICSWKFFYWVETWKKDKISQLLEDFFNEYENDFANNYNSIIDAILDYNNKISDDVIYKISQFAAITYLRWIYFKESFMKMSENMDKFMMIQNYRARKQYTPEDPAIKKISSNSDFEKKILNWEFSLKYNNLSYFKFIFQEMNNYINKFLCQKRIFYISNWERNFITTDYCISEINPEIHDFYWFPFLSKDHYFPLSPKILVVFYDPIKKWKENKRMQIGKREIMYHNFLCWMCWNYIYSKTRQDLNEVEYSKARSMNVEKLYELFPSQFIKDKELKEKVMKDAQELWVNPIKYYDKFCDYVIFWE